MENSIYVASALVAVAFIAVSVKLGVFKSWIRTRDLDKDIDKLNRLLTSCLDNNLHGLKVSVVTEDGRTVVVKDFKPNESKLSLERIDERVILYEEIGVDTIAYPTSDITWLKFESTCDSRKCYIIMPLNGIVSGMDKDFMTYPTLIAHTVPDSVVQEWLSTRDDMADRVTFVFEDGDTQFEVSVPAKDVSFSGRQGLVIKDKDESLDLIKFSISFMSGIVIDLEPSSLDTAVFQSL